ncbi:MAG: DegV family protein [Oscillospiraceae bacterium]|nr:DegV family protein [Oscillospiraceae bacterium]
MFSIVTDTGANLTAEEVRQWDVTVLPMQTDGESTAQVNPFLCEATLRELAQKGDVLCVCLSGALSGTCRAVQMAASNIESPHTVRVLDSQSAACGQGMLVHLAVLARERGADLEKAAQLVQDKAPQVCHLFLAGEEKNTARSGRFGEAVAPSTVLMLDSAGKILPCRKSADRKTALRYIAQMYRRTVLQIGKGVCIAHADCPQEAAYLAGQIGENVRITRLNEVFTCHTGKGAVALFYPGTLRTHPPV